MPQRVLTCPNTTVKFIRHLRTNSSHSSQSSDTDLIQVLDLIQSENVELFTPVYILPFIHQYLRIDSTEPSESCAMTEFLKISRSNISIDYDKLLSDSLMLIKECTNLELWEAMCLLAAQSLQIDFFIISNSSLKHFLDHNLEVFANFSVPYGTTAQFLLDYIDSPQSLSPN